VTSSVSFLFRKSGPNIFQGTTDKSPIGLDKLENMMMEVNPDRFADDDGHRADDYLSRVIEESGSNSSKSIDKGSSNSSKNNTINALLHRFFADEVQSIRFGK